MKGLLITFLLGTCILPAFAQQYFSAPHSSLDQKQVIEAVLRRELAHRKGVVFVRIFERDPSQELVKALSDLSVRILPASRAKDGRRTAGFDVPSVLTYKDELSGKEGPLFDIRRLEWISGNYVRAIGGYDMTWGWGGEPLGASVIIIKLEHNQWKVR